MSPDDMLSYQDIAILEDRARETVRLWKRDGCMPPPDDWVGNSPRWKRSTWARWTDLHGVLPRPIA